MICQRNENLVEREDACPRCAERCIDRLVWIEDGQRIRCATCSTIYTPPVRRPEGGQPDAPST